MIVGGLWDANNAGYPRDSEQRCRQELGDIPVSALNARVRSREFHGPHAAATAFRQSCESRSRSLACSTRWRRMA